MEDIDDLATMVEECLSPLPHAFEDSKMIQRKPLTKSLDFEFPTPVGKLRI